MIKICTQRIIASISRIFPVLMVAAILAGVPSSGWSQTEDYAEEKEKEKVVVTLYNGHTHIGVIESDDGREILIQTEKLGLIYLKKQDIESIEPFSEKAAPLVLPNANSLFYKKYFLNSSMIPMEKGEMNVNLSLFGPEVQAGIGPGLTFGGTASWIGAPLIFEIKYSASISDKLHIGAGVNAGTLGWFNWAAYGVMPYGGVTVGSNDHHFTLKGAYVNAFTGNESREGAAYSMAGFLRFRQRSAFVFEGIYAVSNGENWVAILPGFRFQTSSHRAFQFSMGGMVIDGEPIEMPLPFVSWQMDI